MIKDDQCGWHSQSKGEEEGIINGRVAGDETEWLCRYQIVWGA